MTGRKNRLKSYEANWRRGRDSNPGYAFTAYTRLAGEHLRPLGHLSNLALYI